MRIPYRWRVFLREQPRATLWILGVIVALYLALAVIALAAPEIAGLVVRFLALTPARLLEDGPQGLVTMTFVHAPEALLQVVFNGLLLFSLGRWVEKALGTRRFVVLFVVVAAGAGIAQAGWAFLAGDPERTVMGSTGAMVGVLTAFALLFPDAMLRFWMTAPIRAKNLVWLALGMDLVLLIGDVRVDVPAHLGGMIAAFLLLSRPWRPEWRRAFRARLATLRRALT
jgi:membrane associated rhomboid family serine protease